TLENVRIKLGEYITLELSLFLDSLKFNCELTVEFNQWWSDSCGSYSRPRDAAYYMVYAQQQQTTTAELNLFTYFDRTVNNPFTVFQDCGCSEAGNETSISVMLFRKSGVRGWRSSCKTS